MEVWEKSETVDPEVRAYVHSLVNAVGGQSTLEDKYAVGDDALAVLHDLLRWLRAYDDKLDRLDVKRCLAEANLVKGDLLEILALWPEEAQESIIKAKLALACLQLLVPLTWPIELDEEKTTVNHHRHMPYIQLAQVGYKRAILHFEDAQILRTAIRIGLPAMAQPRRERARRDEGIIKLVLYFFRNVAMITQPQQLPSQGDENEISRSSTIEAFHEQDVFNFLLTVGSGANDEYQEQDVIVLEILFHLLKGVDPKKLFMEKEQLASEETNELEMLMRKERSMHKGYNKHAPTRHNRFGTVIWVKRDDEKVSTVSGQTSITNEGTTFQQMDSSKKYKRPQFRGKQTEEMTENSDFRQRVDLTDNAIGSLRSFIEDFLDSSFNPVFASLRKAIEREAPRVSSAHHKQYFYLVSWFLKAEAARRDRSQKQSQMKPGSTEGLVNDNTYAYVAAVLDQETFVLLNRHMQRAFDEKHWQELNATLLCFTQILLTVQSMAESSDEEDQEIAENIQNRIFYEETTHDRMVQVLRGYTNQGFAYLDTVTECIHVFVRMLERYSKQNADLQIRSKRRARKKKQQSETVEVDAEGNPLNEEDEADDEHEMEMIVRERKFDFARFSAKFLSQPCVDTYVALLHFYADLTPAQLKRCHRYFYRLAFKHELAVLLFRIDILQLLHNMIKGPVSLSTELEGYQEWEQLAQQVFRRCFKWLDRLNEGQGWREAAIVEMLFSKIPNTLYYLQNGFDKVIEKRPPRPPAELEIKPTVAEQQRIPVAVSMLLEQGKQGDVEWIKRELKRAIEERQAWEQQAQSNPGESNDQAMGDTDNSMKEVQTCPTIFLVWDTEERKTALFKDKYLRLLLQTLGCERLGVAEDVDASWVIPTEVSLSQMQQSLESIRRTEFDAPTFDDGKTAADLIRNKSSAREAGTFSDTEDGGGSGDDGWEIDEAMFPANLPEKRKRTNDDGGSKKRRRLRNRRELSDEELKQKAAERLRKEKERNAKIKSSLFVTASDDESDAEADAEFFRLEAQRGRQMAQTIKRQLLEEGEKRRSGLMTKRNEDSAMEDTQPENDEDEDMRLYTGGLDVSADNSEEEEGEGDDAAPRRRARRHHSDSGGSSGDEDSESTRGGLDDDESTPSTSPTSGENVLGEVSGNVVQQKTASGVATEARDDGGDDDDDLPLVKSSATRRNVRAGFIINDSDSE